MAILTLDSWIRKQNFCDLRRGATDAIEACDFMDKTQHLTHLVPSHHASLISIASYTLISGWTLHVGLINPSCPKEVSLNEVQHRIRSSLSATEIPQVILQIPSQLEVCGKRLHLLKDHLPFPKSSHITGKPTSHLWTKATVRRQDGNSIKPWIVAMT